MINRTLDPDDFEGYAAELPGGPEMAKAFISELFRMKYPEIGK